MALVRALGAGRDAARTLCLSLDAPVGAAERLLSLPGYESRVLWSPSFDDEFAGVGAAHVLIATGATRFARIKAAASRLFQGLIRGSLDGTTAPEPCLFGGFAFQPARAAWPASAVWSGFGDARFLLPRIGYKRQGERAWLTVSATGLELASVAARVRLAREAMAALHALGQALRPAPSDIGRPTVIEIPGETDSARTTPVTGRLREIDAGHFEKGVAARHIVVRGTGLPDAALVLERLRTLVPGCTRFALSLGRRTFVGAAPERLIGRLNAGISSEVITGCVPNVNVTCGDALFRNVKQRAGHELIVRGLRAALEPLCERWSECGPHLHALRHHIHLRTGLSGVLKAPLHVLDLVARLHPTATIGRTPRGAALPWLDAHAHADHGLHAGPFGAFDRAGNGEFVVAIRSGVLTAHEARLFAGAGIVAGSHAAREFSEERWKLEGMLRAVGVD